MKRGERLDHQECKPFQTIVSGRESWLRREAKDEREQSSNVLAAGSKLNHLQHVRNDSTKEAEGHKPYGRTNNAFVVETGASEICHLSRRVAKRR